MTWQDLVKTSGNNQTLARAHSTLGCKTIYKLGKGGIDPTQSLTKECDCSGFVAWSIGIPRELPPESNHWLDTNCIWEGGDPVLHDLFKQSTFAKATVGDLLVYPHGKSTNYGHVGIILQIDKSLPGLCTG